MLEPQLAGTTTANARGHWLNVATTFIRLSQYSSARAGALSVWLKSAWPPTTALRLGGNLEMSAAAGGTSDQLYEPCCASRARGVGTAPPSLANLVRSYKCAASCTPEFVVGWSIYGSVWKGGDV